MFVSPSRLCSSYRSSFSDPRTKVSLSQCLRRKMQLCGQIIPLLPNAERSMNCRGKSGLYRIAKAAQSAEVGSEDPAFVSE